MSTCSLASTFTNTTAAGEFLLALVLLAFAALLLKDAGEGLGPRLAA